MRDSTALGRRYLILRGQPMSVASQASDLAKRENGITPFDCPGDNIAAVVKLAQVVGGLDPGRHHRGGLAPYTEPPRPWEERRGRSVERAGRNAASAQAGGRRRR